MIAKLSGWYSGLSLREKILVGIAAGLSAVLVAIYGLYLPLTGSIQEKRINYRAALDRRVAIEAAVASSANRQASVGPQAVSGPIEQLVNQSAAEAGFTLDKAESAGNGRVAIMMTQARPSALLKWLAELEKQGVMVEQIDVKAATAGSVSMTATLAGQSK
jgi:general secretion pathway protein M